MAEALKAVEPSNLMTADEIMDVNDTEYKIIPGWGAKSLRIRSLTADDLIIWSEAIEGEAKRTAGLRLIIQSIVDEQGKPLLNTSHLDMLRKKSHKKTNEIVQAILELNGMNVKATTDAKKD